ncbi:MAG: family N-acetyltransferase [Herbinix sp.]|jgi:ribosomal protein S18 acetylase RimI-like enzyme|nr:family N-acetyltransferase [Herbinix sp.]
MYKIRGYEEKDKERVEQICIATGAKELTGNAEMQKARLTVFCHYYIEQEPQQCFVAVNEQDEAVGYILCAKDFNSWEQEFKKLYLENTMNPITGFLGKGTIDGLKLFSAKYPAHLHIDIHPDFQGKGLGTQLVDALIKHLKDNGVPGLMLCVGSENEGGQKFYRKYGFLELTKGKNEVAMGIEL